MRCYINLILIALSTFTYALPNEGTKGSNQRIFFGHGNPITNTLSNIFFGITSGNRPTNKPQTGLVISVGPTGGNNRPASCRYWCRTPLNQFYCCEDTSQTPSQPGLKPGFCPPVRPECPPTRFGPPQTCSHDYACFGVDKCCYDTCLQQHVCKPPQGYGR